MANFTCIRARKRKGATIKAMAQHNFRDGTREVKNADRDRTQLNVHLAPIATSAGALDVVKTRLEGCKRRKDSVELIEYMVMASPEQFLEGGSLAKDGGRAYFQDVYDWLEAQHGFENVAWATIQYDESTPHLSVGVVPRVEGDKGPKLSASKWLDGRKALAALQDKVAAIGERFGLRRGVRGSPAKHESVRRFYGAINALESDPRLQPMPLRKLESLPPEPGVTDKLTGRAAAMERARAEALAKRKRDEAYNRKAIEHNRSRMKLLEQLAGHGIGRRDSQRERAKLVDEAKQARVVAEEAIERARDGAKATKNVTALANQRGETIETLKAELALQQRQTEMLARDARTLADELIASDPQRAQELGLIDADNSVHHRPL